MDSTPTLRRRVKTVASRNARKAFDLNNWINDDEAQTRYLDCWKRRSLVTQKILKLKFSRNEGFMFQRWLKRQGLKRFFEMASPWYPDLVKVFYCNLKIKNDTLFSGERN